MDEASEARLKAVRAAEQRRIAAMLAGDAAAAETLLSDRLLYVHANGVVEDKQTYLSRLRSSHYRYLAIDLFDEKIESVGTGAIYYARRRVSLYPPGETTVNISDYLTLCVWTEEQGAWKLIAYQGTFATG